MLPFAWWNPEIGSAIGDQSITLEETLSILDRVILQQLDRTVIKTARELILLTEEISIEKAFSLEETLSILDRVGLTQIPRLSVKTARELIALSEDMTVDKAFVLEETLSILDRTILIQTNRLIVNTARELIVLSESMSAVDISIPVIASCEIAIADEDSDNDRARCRFTTGVFCESVRVERSIDGGGYVFHQSIDTSPSTGPTTTNYYSGSEGETLSFRIRPFREDGQSGTEGTACITNQVILGFA